MPLLRLAILLLCLPGPLLAVDTAATGMANLMRGMITGLSLLGQASNANQGLNYPGLGVPGAYGYSGLFPGATPWSTTPWSSVPWAGIPWATPGMLGPTQSGAYWPPGSPFYPPFASTPYATSPYRRINSTSLRHLQGSWETNNGGLLIVEGRLARLYLSRDLHQDLELTLDNRYLWIRPVANPRGQTERYEYRFVDKRVMLRDDLGRVLILRRYVPGWKRR